MVKPRFDIDLLPSGPLFRAAEYREGAVYLTFDFGEGLRTADHGELLTFEVAEVDGLYVPVKATVVENRIKLDVDKTCRPRYVRYGRQPFTRANLVNRDGLPASTFKAAVPD